MRDPEYAPLWAGQLDRAAARTLPHQALRIALHGEYAARAFHQHMAQAFQARAPFPALARRVESRIIGLDRLCSRHGVPRPTDPFPQETRLETSWRANLVRAIRGEQATAALHVRLARELGDADLREHFLCLGHESLERQLPLLQRALQDAIEREGMHARAGVPADEAYMKHGFIGDFMEKAFSVLAGQHGALGVVAPPLKTGPALLSGIAAGALGMHFARQRIRKNRKEA